MTRERLSVAESVNALKDRKIDAFFWVGGVPTPSITDLAATPGIKVEARSITATAAENMRKKYGPDLREEPASSPTPIPGEARDTTNVDVWNLLVVPEKADEKLVYEITKTIFEKKEELVKVHKDARLPRSRQPATRAPRPIPFHPGAVRYFKEKGEVQRPIGPVRAIL